MNNKKVSRSCETCNRKFLIYRCKIGKGGQGRFCSRTCMAKWNSKGERNPMYNSQRFGSLNPNWKGGITPWRRLVYASKKWKNWSNSVREIWNYTCQICGKRGHGDIHANHIKKFIDHPLLRFEVKNGIALCKYCHVSLVNNHEPEWESYFSFCWESKLL